MAIPMIQGMPSRHDHRTALCSQRTSVRLYPWRFLICYLYRCELGELRLFFGEVEDWRLCSYMAPCRQSAGNLQLLYTPFLDLAVEGVFHVAGDPLAEGV